MATFRLSKWYLDCVNEAGDVSMGYSSAAQWGLAHLHYSLLIENTSGFDRSWDSLRSSPEPSVEGTTIRWCCDPIGVNAEWTRDGDELHETVFQNAEGSIEWRCAAPRASARIKNREGLGYVEQLIMTIPPWRIPIQTLTCGRFLTATDWIVWLAWTQPPETPRKNIYLNGTRAEHPVIEDDELRFGDGARLTLDRSLQLTHREVDTSTLPEIPGLSGTFPGRLLQLNECKWRSRAVLERQGFAPLEGWAIHEELVWPGA